MSNSPHDGEDNETIHGNRTGRGYGGLYPADRAAVLEDEAQRLGGVIAGVVDRTRIHMEVQE